jgi:ABC-type transport system substrate-binding protein
MLNTAIPPLDNVKVRQAVQLAIDRQRIIDEVRGGYAHTTDGIYPKGLIGYSEENQGWLKYDPEEAARLVKEAGLKENDTVELVISSVADMDNQKIISIIQENLNAVGLNTVTIIYDPESRLYFRRNGQAMAYIFDWTADYNDPDNFIYTIFGTEDSVKRYSSNYSDRQAMKRIAGARNIEDDEERLAEYRSLEKKLVQDDAVWVPLYSAEHIYMMGDRLESYIPYWAGWSDVVLKDMVLK